MKFIAMTKDTSVAQDRFVMFQLGAGNESTKSGIHFLAASVPHLVVDY